MLCDPVSNLCGILETILNERLNKIQWGIRGSVGFFCLFFSLQDSKTLQICRCLKILQGFTKRDETTEEVSRARDDWHQPVVCVGLTTATEAGREGRTGEQADHV